LCRCRIRTIDSVANLAARVVFAGQGSNALGNSVDIVHVLAVLHIGTRSSLPTDPVGSAVIIGTQALLGGTTPAQGITPTAAIHCAPPTRIAFHESHASRHRKDIVGSGTIGENGTGTSHGAGALGGTIGSVTTRVLAIGAHERGSCAQKCQEEETPPAATFRGQSGDLHWVQLHNLFACFFV